VASAAFEVGDSVLRSIADNGEGTCGDRGLGAPPNPDSAPAPSSQRPSWCTQLIQEAQRRHNLSPMATVALGRAMISTMLMATFKGPDEVTQVQIKGEGPLGQIMVVSDEKARVKAVVYNPGCETLINKEGGLDVAGAVGMPGFISVTRSHPLSAAPYTGTVPILSGEIGEDLAHYMVESEQVQSALAVGVRLDENAKVTEAGGFLIQVLPFVGDDTVEALEKNITALPPITMCFQEGMTPADVTVKLLEDIGVSEGGFALTPTYGPCDEEDLKKRMMRAVAALGMEEVDSIIEEQGHVEVRCDFCNCDVQFNREEIAAAIEGTDEDIKVERM